MAELSSLVRFDWFLPAVLYSITNTRVPYRVPLVQNWMVSKPIPPASYPMIRVYRQNTKGPARSDRPFHHVLNGLQQSVGYESPTESGTHYLLLETELVGESSSLFFPLRLADAAICVDICEVEFCDAFSDRRCTEGGGYPRLGDRKFGHRASSARTATS